MSKSAKNAIREDIALDVAKAEEELVGLSAEAAELAKKKKEEKRRSREKAPGDRFQEEQEQGGVKCIRKDHFEDAMRRARPVSAMKVFKCTKVS